MANYGKAARKERVVTRERHMLIEADRIRRDSRVGRNLEEQMTLARAAVKRTGEALDMAQNRLDHIAEEFDGINWAVLQRNLELSLFDLKCSGEGCERRATEALPVYMILRLLMTQSGVEVPVMDDPMTALGLVEASDLKSVPFYYCGECAAILARKLNLRFFPLSQTIRQWSSHKKEHDKNGRLREVGVAEQQLCRCMSAFEGARKRLANLKAEADQEVQREDRRQSKMVATLAAGLGLRQSAA